MKRLRLPLALAATAILLPATAWAGSLKPDRVSIDAKWLAHVDVAALTETQAIKKVRGVWPGRTEKFRTWMQDNYGIDPRDDFESVTLYGTGYEKGDCVVILTSDYSRDKVLSRIDQQEDVQETEWRGHTIYTCERGEKESDSQSGHAESSYGRSGESKRVAWVLVDDDTVVYAKSKRGVKDAVETIEGYAASLEGEGSKLTADLPEGAVVYAAAIELASIDHDGFVFPLLRQHERACYALGERDGELFDQLKLVAKSERVAEQMKQVIEGYAAALMVGAMDCEPLRKMLDNVEVERDGVTVEAAWNGEVERFAQALEDFKRKRRR